MAKRTNAIASDLEGISKSADSKVLALLNETRSPEVHTDKPSDKAANVQNQNKTRVENSSPNNKSKSTRQRHLESWGKPVAGFNTRIPEQMSEKIEDLVYKLRKNGKPKTKQALTLEAFHDLLRKYSIS